MFTTMLLTVALFQTPGIEVTPSEVKIEVSLNLVEHFKNLSSAKIAEEVRVSIANENDPNAEVDVLGTWAFDRKLIFRPKYGFEKETRYRVTFKTEIFGGQLFELPASTKSKPLSAEFQPKLTQVPANMLRFYLEFSEPMVRGQLAKYLVLQDAKGKEVDEAFLELEEELWDDQRKRVTVFFNPGRVKQELQPHAELGPILLQGQSYVLKLKAGFKATNGTKLPKDLAHKFEVNAALEKAINAGDWKITVENSALQSIVKVGFDRPMDTALLARVVHLETSSGEKIPSEIIIDSGGLSIRIYSRQKLPAGEYAVIARDTLEDICGNRVGAAFDLKVREGDAIGKRGSKEPTRVSFTVPK
jgi:hypothetical protein